MHPAIPFIVVGAGGFVVQMAVLAALSLGLDLSPVISTVLAVEAAVLTNFFWHERWTFADRVGGPRGRLVRLGRFHAAAMTSIAGNVAVTAICVRHLGLNVFAGNVAAVALLGIANFIAADRWVFASRVTLVGILLAGLSPAPAHAAEPGADTIAAWNRHVTKVEASLARHEQDPPLAEPRGVSVEVPGGTIYEWRGSARIENTTVGEVVDRLIATAGEAFEEAVLSAKVLERHDDRLRVYMQLQRKVLVTATYDTEHDVRYERRSPSFATSRSVSTRIAEVGGADRGFLWKLNSYWQYRQVGSGVQVDVLSVSLSRDVPWMVRSIAQPIVRRIGRESMQRTLTATERRAAPGRAQAAVRRR